MVLGKVVALRVNRGLSVTSSDQDRPQLHSSYLRAGSSEPPHSEVCFEFCSFLTNICFYLAWHSCFTCTQETILALVLWILLRGILAGFL